MPPEMGAPASDGATGDGNCFSNAVVRTRAGGTKGVGKRVDSREEKLRAAAAGRRAISIIRHPIITLRYFGRSAARWIRSTCRAVASHPAFALLLAPGAVAWVLLEAFPGPHTAVINQVEHALKFASWWVGLGVLSSVGLGCGVHSGILFLVPHIMKTCLAAEECNSLDFRASGNMWFSNAEDLFSCPENGDISISSSSEGFLDGGDGVTSSPVSYLGTLLKVYPACVLWGIGTAIGEIPPYAISRAAAEAGEEVGEGDELRELGKSDPSVGKFDLVARCKVWMIRFLRRRGFLGVFFLSACPNMAFDLCGMCCGHFMMPFSTFFGGILLGKAGVRVLVQTAFFTMLFHEKHLESFIGVVRRWTPGPYDLGGFLHASLVQGKAQFRGSGVAAASNAGQYGAPEDAVGNVPGGVIPGIVSRLKATWSVMLAAIVLVFVLSCIEQIAQRSAAEDDKDTLGVAIEKTESKRRYAGTTRPVGNASCGTAVSVEHGLCIPPEEGGSMPKDSTKMAS